MITLERIAHLTNTSPATVSRAIRGSTRVSKETRERVIAVAKQFNYRPNLVARSMVTSSTQLIGLLLPHSTPGPFSRVIGGIERAARKAGYSVVFCQTESDEQILNEHLELLGCRRVDGVLLCPHSDAHFSLSCLDELGPAATRVPVVLVQEPLEQDQYASVTVDNFNGAKVLCRHLIDHGHRDIGFLWLNPNRTSRKRYDGYRAAMEEAGEDPRRVQCAEVQLRPGPLTKEPNVYVDPHVDPEYVDPYVDPDWISETLARHPHWTALAVSHDMLAIKVIRALKAIAKRVPEDIAVVGFDDVLVSAFVDPPLTTMRQPSAEVGEVACNLLLDQIARKAKGGELTSVLMPCTLRVRQSCGCSRTKPAS